MFTANKPFGSKFVSFFLSLFLIGSCISTRCPAIASDTNELNFKVYNPDSASPANSQTNSSGVSDQGSISGDSTSQALKPSLAKESTSGSAASNVANPGLSAETPHSDSSVTQSDNQTGTTNSQTASTASSTPTQPDSSPASSSNPTSTSETASENKSSTATQASANQSDDKSNAIKDTVTETSIGTTVGDAAASPSNNKVLQGYVRIVPSGTKIPIVMDTAVDSDTSQEGDEFSARTVEDLTIDGTTVIPAGSIIRGRIAN